VGYDKNSTAFPEQIAEYEVKSYLSNNSVVNSGFESNISNTTVFAANVTSTLDS
jgi:hypothetical protein